MRPIIIDNGLHLKSTMNHGSPSAGLPIAIANIAIVFHYSITLNNACGIKVKN